VHSLQKLAEERDQLDSDLQHFRKINTDSQHEGRIAALQRKLGESEGEKKELQRLLDTAAQEMDKLKEAVCIPIGPRTRWKIRSADMHLTTAKPCQPDQ
jgi:uncharacterized protein HemX